MAVLGDFDTPHDLDSVTLALVARGKEILAADETVPTLTKRFDALAIQSTERSRCTYRGMPFFRGRRIHPRRHQADETISQKSAEGTPSAQLLSSKASIPAAGFGKFSSDRAISQCSPKVWNAKPCPMP